MLYTGKHKYRGWSICSTFWTSTKGKISPSTSRFSIFLPKIRHLKFIKSTVRVYRSLWPIAENLIVGGRHSRSKMKMSSTKCGSWKWRKNMKPKRKIFRRKIQPSRSNPSPKPHKINSHLWTWPQDINLLLPTSTASARPRKETNSTQSRRKEEKKSFPLLDLPRKENRNRRKKAQG